MTKTAINSLPERSTLPQPRTSTNQVTEQVQSFCRQFINRFLRDDFQDLEEIPLDALDINVPRQAIKLICLHQDNDSLLHTLIRLCIYGFFVKPINQGYLMPDVWLHETFNFVPQVQLYFVDDPKTRTYKFKNNPLEGLCSFRLHNIDITQASAANEIERLANRIFTNFNKFEYTKGKFKFTYRDEQNKLNTWGFFASESEARSLFRNICQVMQITYSDDNLFEHKPKGDYSTPEKRKVLGRTFEIHRRRSGVVQFQEATLHISGIRSISLCDSFKIRLRGDWQSELIQTFYA